MTVLLAEQQVVRGKFFERKHPGFSESCRKIAVSSPGPGESPLWGGGLPEIGLGHGAGVCWAFCWLGVSHGSPWIQQLGFWASPSPSRLPLQKAVVGQRLPTDLHNCTVP